MGKSEFEPVTSFDDWYDRRREDHRTGALGDFALAPCASRLWSQFEKYKTEHLGRTANFHKYEKMASAEVVSPSAAKWRRSIPVRPRIHSSVVSSVASKWLFSTTRSGR